LLELKKKNKNGQKVFNSYLKIENDYNQKVESYIKKIAVNYQIDIREVQ
jgi:hypothetical protein